MAELRKISDDITIMRDGTYVGTWEMKNISDDEIVKKMVGRELTNIYPPLENEPGDVLLEVKNFTSIHDKSFKNCSFTLRKGEILGFGGLVGAQRTELMEAIFGIRHTTSGEVFLNGKKLDIKRPQDAIKNGIGMITEDRRGSGILGCLSVADNVSIASLNQYVEGGIKLNKKKIEDLVQENVAKLSIKTPSSKTLIQSLSGGNQQKVIISRWLANNPDVLIMDEPTRGIDVGAKYEIYQIMIQLAKQGKGIIMISSEMPELLGVSNRIMVMCNGKITGELSGEEATQENVMHYATQF
jgi:methyl-galactoside transport system ATP-binding protein